MRRLLALALALCLPAPVFADVAVGNGSIGVPLTAPQGGTGQTSYATNCAVVASSSSALTCTLSPTLTGTNFTGIPNAALATTPVTSVSASGNLASSGGTTPAITIANAPTFSGIVTGSYFSATTSAGYTFPAGGGVQEDGSGNSYLYPMYQHVYIENAVGTKLADFNGVTGSTSFLYPTSTTQLWQSAASQFATRHALSSGAYTFTFPAAFTSTPICVATGEANLSILKVAASTASCIVTSASGADSQTVDIVAIGNPS